MTFAQPYRGESLLSNSTEVNGTIAIVSRDDLDEVPQASRASFDMKVQHCAQAGAIAVLIANTKDDLPQFVVNCRTIPSALITKSYAAALKDGDHVVVDDSSISLTASTTAKAARLPPPSGPASNAQQTAAVSTASVEKASVKPMVADPLASLGGAMNAKDRADPLAALPATKVDPLAALGRANSTITSVKPMVADPLASLGGAMNAKDRVDP